MSRGQLPGRSFTRPLSSSITATRSLARLLRDPQRQELDPLDYAEVGAKGGVTAVEDGAIGRRGRNWNDVFSSM